MKTGAWKIGKQMGLTVTVLALCGLAGCSFLPHRELTAPCSDYKAAGYAPAADGAEHVPCDDPLPMVRPPWTAALEPPAQPTGGAAGPAHAGRHT